MQLLKDLQEQIDRIWEPVLCPMRTPISEDLLGPPYSTLSSDSVYKRHDDTLKSFDNKELVFTVYIKINEHMKSLVYTRQSSMYGGLNSDSTSRFANQFRANTLLSTSFKNATSNLLHPQNPRQAAEV